MTESRLPSRHDARAPARTLAEHLGRTARLAVPVVISRSGLLILVAVDTAMTGHASGGAGELAALAIGMAPQVFLLVVGIGILVGTQVLTAQADGAGQSAECGAIWRVGLIHGAVLGAVAGVLCLVGEPFLLATGQSAELAQGGGRVMAMFSWSMPLMMMAVVSINFLEGIGRPLAPMVITLAGNVLNVGLNWMLIYGNLGAPEMGAAGAAMATAIVRSAIAVALFVHVARMAGGWHYGIGRPVPDPWGLSRRLRRAGYPLGVAYALETLAFTTLVIMAGHLGTRDLAGYQIAFNLITLAFMVSLGIGTAASVRVANAVGRGDGAGIGTAGWTGMVMIAAVMAILGAVLVVAPDAVARIYTSDSRVIAVSVAAIWICGFAVVFDGIQAVGISALRGLGDMWAAAALHLGAFWGVTVPAGAWFAFAQDMGAAGRALGHRLGTMVDAALVCLRFRVVSRRGGRRV